MSDSDAVPEGMVLNAAGRRVPATVNGISQVPYAGIGTHRPMGRKAGPPVRSVSNYPLRGDKRLPDLESALAACELRAGMTVSSHHHLRDGDAVALPALQAAARLGVKDLRWFPSATFPCQAAAIDLMESGVVQRIEGSLNGPLGDYCSRGKMRGVGVLRSHGCRWQAIQDGEVHVDVAVIAAPSADFFGNANGVRGRSACGSLGFALADSIYADRVIVVTDNLEPFPCIPWQIQGNNVDFVVEVASIGDASRIVAGTTRGTHSPVQLAIANLVAEFINAAGILREGYSFQAGAGGISLAVIEPLARLMRAKNVKARFVRGGSTKALVDMLQGGLTDYILDGQTFDLDAVKSLAGDLRHVATTPFTSYNFHGKGNFASLVDVAILGATEVDVHFNGNVVSHSDGRALHGIGGWQDCLRAACSILALPAVRRGESTIRDRVTTLTGPSDLVDVIVTELGVCINPRRFDLIEAVRGSRLPLRTIEDLQRAAEGASTVKPTRPTTSGREVAIVKWVDGTVLDCIWQQA
jgi:citrate lyase subunit alpha/citrate CoA-transferase